MLFEVKEQKYFWIHEKQSNEWASFFSHVYEAPLAVTQKWALIQAPIQ